MWGYENWALTIELERMLEVCNYRLLRKIVGITIYDLAEHQISMD